LRGWTAESLDNGREEVIMIIERECSAPQEGCRQPLGIESFQLRLVLKEKLTIPMYGGKIQIVHHRTTTLFREHCSVRKQIKQ